MDDISTNEIIKAKYTMKLTNKIHKEIDVNANNPIIQQNGWKELKHH